MTKKPTHRGGNPPVKNQFQKGTSGNPKGRPRGAKNRRTIILGAMGEKVSAQEGGRSKRMRVGEAAVKVLVRDALGGDLAALKQILALWADAEAAADAAREPTYPITEADRLVIKVVYERMMACASEGQP